MLVPQVVKGEGSGKPSKLQPSTSTSPPSHEEHVATVCDEAIYIREDARVVRAAITATSLATEQESGNINKTRSTKNLNEPSPQETGLASGPEVNTSGSGEGRMEHQDDLMNFVQPSPHDSPLSGGHTPGSDEGRPSINELMERNLKTRPMFKESDFVPMDSEVVKDSGKKDESSSKQVESKKKRAGLKLKPKSPKKLKLRLLMQVSTAGSVTTALRVTTAVEVTTNDNDWSNGSYN
nr:hypothetical protein [Tanacetum cinerariifolium]